MIYILFGFAEGSLNGATAIRRELRPRRPSLSRLFDAKPLRVFPSAPRPLDPPR